MEYVIDRSKWVCGGMREYPQLGMGCLLNDIGRQCCLGQVLSQDGVSDGTLYEEPTPSDATQKTSWLVDSCGNSPATFALMKINDQVGISQKTRERLLTKEAKKHGVTFRFTGRLGTRRKTTNETPLYGTQ